jgi:NAD(P)-dependent dehydrogenase (short-subunit alcohol dehydrogenase family)
MSALAGRVALVTGVSRSAGIGAALVRRLAADGGFRRSS